MDIIEEEPEKRLFTNTRFEVSDKSMAQWMKALVIGKHAGDSVEGVSTADENMPEEEKLSTLLKRCVLRSTPLKRQHSLP